MDVRTKAVFFFALAVAFAAGGCGFAPQQSKFQTAFLPPAPHASAAVALSEPALVPPPPALPPDVPPVVPAKPEISQRQVRADRMVRQADQRFQRGQRYRSEERRVGKECRS